MTMNIQRSSTRVIVNTGAQYVRSIINLVISLYSTRLILNALGINDYGIYSLVAGVVAMLAFISNALVSTTQRFLSYHQTKSTEEFLSALFGNIVILHVAFSIILILVMELLRPYLFSGFLNISPEKIKTAVFVYQCAIFMVTISFLYAPFLAVLISHENIVYSSIVQVIDSFLRLGIAILITYVSKYRLETYVSLLCLISLSDFLAYSIYAFRKYTECVMPKFKHLSNKIIKKIANFLVWQIYSTGCVVGRTQGTAIVLNRFFGTFINASFGIAQQVSGAISFVSVSLMNAINPQIIKAEGSGDRKRMFELTMTASKFSFCLLAIFVIPLVANMDLILHLWLGEIPKHAILFCRVILIACLCDQITAGLITANQAIGNVRSYSLTINSIKLFTVPIIAYLLYLRINISNVIWSYAVMELICAFCRLPFLKHYGGLKVRSFIKDVFVKSSFPLLFLIIAYYFQVHFISQVLLIIVFAIIVSLLCVVIIYSLSLTPAERLVIQGILRRIKLKK